MTGPDPLEQPLREWPLRKGFRPITDEVLEAMRVAGAQAAGRIVDQAKNLFVGNPFPPEMHVPIVVRKIGSTMQIGIDHVGADWPARAEAYRRERQAVIDADLATHAELLRLHPGDTIPRAFLLEHQPHEFDAFGERVTVCRGCPEVYDSYDDNEPAPWPCGPWRLVDERTPR